MFTQFSVVGPNSILDCNLEARYEISRIRYMVTKRVAILKNGKLMRENATYDISILIKTEMLTQFIKKIAVYNFCENLLSFCRIITSDEGNRSHFATFVWNAHKKRLARSFITLAVETALCLSVHQVDVMCGVRDVTLILCDKLRRITYN